MNEWGLPISKDKIIARRNRLIEYQKLGELRFTPLYEAIDENILDINYMLHEIENLQSKIDKANELIKRKLSTETYQHLKKLYDDIDNTEEIWEDYEFEDLRDILKEDK